MRLRSFFFIALFLFAGGFISAQNWIAITSDSPVPAATTLVATDASATVVEFNLEGFTLNKVTTPRGEAFIIDIEGGTSLLEKGKPDLPKLTASLIIPDQARMATRIVSSRYVDYPSMEIAPSKGDFTRDIDPATVPFTYGKTYDRDENFPAEQASLTDPYIFRDYRGQVLVVNPFSYNPVTKTLRVYYEMTVEVYADGVSDFNVLNRKRQSEKMDSEFKRVYNRHFLNAEATTRYTPLEEEGSMLIISHGPFIPELQAFKEWKTTIGRKVEIVDVATIGNAAAIKTYVADYYSTNGLTYLLLVGDHAQVPTIMTGNPGLGGPSDPAYGYILGNDHHPEIFVGRFSAEEVAHVQTQVNRTITYEKNPTVTSDWFSRGIGIASSEGPGDNNEYDYQHLNIIKGKLINFSYSHVAELYDGSQGGIDAPGNPSPAMVGQEINTGSSIINYCGHGSPTSWSSSGYSNTHINQLTNNHGWPFIISVACVNGEFMNRTCFAEAWLRASNAQGPTGSIGALMSTINQLWRPPMRGQDAMIDIMVEATANNIKRTFGGISTNGIMDMMDAYGTTGIETADTWLLFGDPSVMVRTKLPEQLVVTHNPETFIGSSQFEINCEVENAYACLTLDGEIIGTAYIENGEAIIDIPTLNNVGVMKLAVTAFNYIPYIVDVDIFPLDGPYVSYRSLTINDAEGNNNQQLDYGESVKLSLEFKNVGTENVQNVQVTISTENPSVTISDATEIYPSLAAGESVAVADGFAFSIGNDLPDGYKLKFNYVATAGTEEWSGNFTITTHSAMLEYDNYTLTDENGNNNGKADPGETVEIHVSVINSGGSPANNLTGVLSTTNEHILIHEDSVNFGTINANGGTLTGTFSVTSSPESPTGNLAEFQFNLTADDGFTAEGSFQIVIGQIPVVIIDMDKNNNSGPKMKASLANLSLSSEYLTTWPTAIDTYQSVFVCLGTYPNGYVLNATEGQMLATFLTNGGKVYMEGGDTWAFNTATAAHAMFMINGVSDGSSDLAILNGQPGTITEGMAFGFGGDNNYIDRLSPKPNAVSLFKNSGPVYDATIAYDGGTYKTIGSSFEFGGLTDGLGSSVKDSLMMEYITYFGISNSAPLLANFVASKSKVCENEEITFKDYSAGELTSWSWSFPGGVPATSTDQDPVVSYAVPGNYDVTLTVTSEDNSSTVTKPGYITVDYCMAVENLTDLNQVKVYPNPGNGRFSVELPAFEGETTLKVISISGSEVYRSVTGESGIRMIQLPETSQGVYILMIDNAKMSKRVKLIVGQ